MAKLLSEPVNSYRAIPQNIKFLITNPCAASPYVYLETLVPVLGNVVLELLTFGLSDVLIGYARPKIPRGRPRYGRGTKRRVVGRDGRRRPQRGAFALPEVGNEIGKILPGSERVQSLSDNKIGHLIWLPIDVIERGLWYWLVADLTKDSIYDWASDIYTEECNVDKNKDRWATWDGGWTGQQFQLPPVFKGTQPYYYGTQQLKGVTYPQLVWSWTFPRSGFCFFHITANCKQLLGPGTTELRIFLRNKNGIINLVKTVRADYFSFATAVWTISTKFVDCTGVMATFKKISGSFPSALSGTVQYMIDVREP